MEEIRREREEKNTCRSLYPAVPRASMRGIHILSAGPGPKPGDTRRRTRGARAGAERRGRDEQKEPSDRQGGRLRGEPETDELMLETAGGPCFRASNDLAGATMRRWCWHR